MSQENVESVQAVYARWSKGDLRATLDVADPLILFVQPQSITFEAGAIMGIEELIDYMRRHLESWSEMTIEAEDITDTGNGTIMATVFQHAVGRESGAETDLRYYQLWSFRGGKVIRLENFRERAEALDAAGLSEQDARADS